MTTRKLTKKQSFKFKQPRQNLMPKPFRGRSFRTGVPSEPGMYWWDEWDCKIEVKKRGQSLYVTPPAKTAVEVRITKNIAGNFFKLELA